MVKLLIHYFIISLTCNVDLCKGKKKKTVLTPSGRSTSREILERIKKRREAEDTDNSATKGNTWKQACLLPRKSTTLLVSWRPIYSTLR